MKAQAVFAMEFLCPQHCLVELDEGDMRDVMTVRQLRQMAESRHDCKPLRPAVPAFREPA